MTQERTQERTQANPPRPVVLCILDGWGHREGREMNAIALAETPNWDRFMASFPHALLQASEGEVGLPPGQMGNSEVGHMNLGAGRIVLQDLPRIDAAVASGRLAENEALRDFIAKLRASGGTCHLMGLLSPGGVHSHQAHLVALAKIVDAAGVPVALHAFLDGRDTPPKSALGYVEAFLAATKDVAGLRAASVMGRYYAMDRDNRWERIEKAYRALVEGKGPRAEDPMAAINASYAKNVTDEFVEPVALGDYAGMRDGDGVLMGNFRADRVRQILAALLDPDFKAFLRTKPIRFCAATGLTEYAKELNAFHTVLFPCARPEGTLGEAVAKAGKTQLRIAETEKYAHVTFFLNGGRERPYAGEERILVPSPKVATYDLKPEMSAFEVTDRLVEAVGAGRFDLIVVNYANTDMVGHSGKLEAAIRAVEAVDACLGRLAAAVREAGGALLITADHGNVERMQDAKTGEPHTAHTLDRVPVVLINGPAARLTDGVLADVAPTLFELLSLPKPKEMTGHSLLIPDPAAARAKPERRATA
ncbi:MAG: 2,3-bisphosphoglycerate-independent phosphoglycerate mutase [Pseudomonadota bacterium]